MGPLALLALAALQDPTPADLAKATENTRKAKSYAFTLSRKDGSRNSRNGPPDITGVFAAGALYIKYGEIELAFGAGGTLARVGGGDWGGVAEAKAKVKAMETPPPLFIDELLKLAPPHTIVERFLSYAPKAAGRTQSPGQVFEGPIAAGTAQKLQDEIWFRQGDDRELTSPEGTGRAAIDGDKRVAGLEFALKGRLMPGTGRQGQRPPGGRQPPQNPRQAQGYNTPEMTFTLQVTLEKFDKAELPADVAKRLGADK